MGPSVQQKYYSSEVQHDVTKDFVGLPTESTGEEFLTRACVIQQYLQLLHYSPDHGDNCIMEPNFG